MQPTLIKSRGGVFEVVLDGELLFSKKEAGRFPASGEVTATARLPPARGRLTGPGHPGPPEMLGALTALLAAIWIALALAPRAPAAAGPRPAADSAALPPPTTILLPVRDEEANLAACAATLVAQGGTPALRIVDDGSTDRTPQRSLPGIAPRRAPGDRARRPAARSQAGGAR